MTISHSEDGFNVLGDDLFGDPVKPQTESITNKRFVFPPFSILDSKQGEWQERKRHWIAMGLKSEVGRGGLGDTSISGVDYFNEGETIAGDAGSVFDPVLCELVYRWFSPKGGQVVDPFAGGSVRGVVAKALERRYWGGDLRPEQIKANIYQAEEIFEGYDGETEDMFGGPDLEWVCGDSMETLKRAPAADFIFSCPPYGDLEVYSDDPNDLSTMDYHAFLAAYKRIILAACGRLKDNRFACFVVGDFRDKKGFYRNFVSETIGAFEECSVHLYNEAILATPIGTAMLRANRQFNAARKLVKTHQNVLVFCKGDPKMATQEIENPSYIEDLKALAEEALAANKTAPTPPENDWQSKTTVKKGNIGEEFIRKYLEATGQTVYQTATDQAHPVDMFCSSADKTRQYFVEVKTKPRRQAYPDTGFDISCWEDYKALQKKSNLVVWVFFCDEKRGDVYGGPLDQIQKPHQLWVRGKQITYPFPTVANNGDKIVYFPCELMTSICALPPNYRARLRELSTMNEAYIYDLGGYR